MIADVDEGWEEVSVSGAGGGVSEGALREIDLLELLHAFPLRELVARTVLFTHAVSTCQDPLACSDLMKNNLKTLLCVIFDSLIHLRTVTRYRPAIKIV